jgi:hypothetical protein
VGIYFPYWAVHPHFFLFLEMNIMSQQTFHAMVVKFNKSSDMSEKVYLSTLIKKELNRREIKPAMTFSLV